MWYSPFIESFTKDEDGHCKPFNNGNIFTDTASHFHWKLHTNDGFEPLEDMRRIIKESGLSAHRFSIHGVFEELHESEYNDGRLMVQLYYGLNGGSPYGDKSKFDDKWIWYVNQISHIMMLLSHFGYNRPMLHYIDDPRRSDVYTAYIGCQRKEEEK